MTAARPTPSASVFSRALLVATLGLSAMHPVGCAQPDESSVSIAIQGKHGLVVGESTVLTAQTEHGTDHGYAWQSSDPAIVVVDAMGLVTALAPGEATVSARGLDTESTASHAIVVTADSGMSGTGTGTGETEATGGSQGETGESETGSDGTGVEVPFVEAWRMSPHANAASESFRHWDEDGEIPVRCARCHSGTGFRDFLGADGSWPEVVDVPHAPGSLVDCRSCHNDASARLDHVEFPSGVVIDQLGKEANCMTCHQGRASADSVDEAILVAGVGDDEVSGDLNFQNVHYYPAGAVLYAGQVRGGYQYSGAVYDHQFRHVPEHSTCTGCHDPHSTRVKYDECATCHTGVLDANSAREIRMMASLNIDFDGDGDTSRGVYHELVGLRDRLRTAISAYASEIIGRPICYGPGHHPYWFHSHTGKIADCSDAEAVRDNAYATWTPRLLRATYNYQLAHTDNGAYAHNFAYVVQLLRDSIDDLNSVITMDVDLGEARRTVIGHFNGASEAARHWDEDDAISGSCSKCHSGATGFRFFVEHGVSTEVLETANGLECYTCHENFGPSYDVLQVDSTTYPGGTTLELPGHDNLCGTCHSGRESKATIDQAISEGRLGFRNVHYLPAAALVQGTRAQVGYEYDGKTYAGTLKHAQRNQCTGCHVVGAEQHSFRIVDTWQATCASCHANETSPEQVRTVHLEDYDGDGNVLEPLPGELSTLQSKLLAAMRSVTTPPICYEAHSYPYWFNDRVGSSTGICDPSDATGSNRFGAWTAPLMKAAHNYQLVQKDPGAYAHNFGYAGQLLFDAIADLGSTTEGLTRP